MVEYVEASWDIPHCKFEQTAEGFKIEARTIRPVTLGAALLMPLGLLAFYALPAGAWYLFGWLGAVAALVAWGWAAWKISWIMTKIEVTKDAVIVDGKRLRRADFRGFGLGKSYPDKRGQPVMLVYKYGNLTIDFGGLWKREKAVEFLSVLNPYIRRTLQSGDDHTVSAEQLRGIRPTEF